MTARLLSGEEAASYCGISTRTFFRYIRQGLLPQRLHGTLKWDRHAIDQAIDRLSNLKKESTANDNEPQLDAYQRWVQQQHQRG